MQKTYDNYIKLINYQLSNVKDVKILRRIYLIICTLIKD